MRNAFVGNEINCFYNPMNPLEAAASLDIHYLLYFFTSVRLKTQTNSIGYRFRQGALCSVGQE